MGDLLRADGGVRGGPYHPAAPAGPALPTQRPLWGDNRRVLAGPPPHQVTERKHTGKQGERAGDQRAEPTHSGGERGEARPAPTSDTWL